VSKKMLTEKLAALLAIDRARRQPSQTSALLDEGRSLDGGVPQKAFTMTPAPNSESPRPRVYPGDQDEKSISLHAAVAQKKDPYNE
jgi:hypothetical protein